MKFKAYRYFFYILLRCGMFTIGLMPRKLVLLFMRGIGKSLFFVLRRERNKVLKNLSFAYGENLTAIQIRELAKDVFINFALTLADLSLMWKMPIEKVKRLVELLPEDEARLEKILAQKTGIVFSASHLGNWELLSAYMAICFNHSRETQVIGKRIYFKPYDTLLVRLRERFFTTTVYRDTSFKTIVKNLKNGGAIGILPDQDIASIPGIFVDFFGKPAYTTDAPARLAYLSRSVIIPFYMVRHGDKYRMMIDEFIHFDYSKDKEDEIRDITQRLSWSVEKYVKQFPSQWGWTHNRWKTQATALKEDNV
ncbi:lysophospholipid acyltransferase family protein [Candidatus Omnitrophota bacterium]